jgi:hypothetical protein
VGFSRHEFVLIVGEFERVDDRAVIEVELLERGRVRGKPADLPSMGDTPFTQGERFELWEMQGSWIPAWVYTPEFVSMDTQMRSCDCKGSNQKVFSSSLKKVCFSHLSMSPSGPCSHHSTEMFRCRLLSLFRTFWKAVECTRLT